MPASVGARPKFRDDVERQSRWLTEHAPREWVEAFFDGLDEVRTRLARFPELGTIVKADERVVLRELALPRGLPYLVQYAHGLTRPVRRVWLVRLFHYGQERRQPDLVGWPW